MSIKYILAILLSLAFCSNALAEPNNDKNLISVSGEAEIAVVPDEVLVSFSIEKNHKNIKEAQRQNDEVADKILKIMKDKLAIDEKDIQTSYITVNPVYSYPQCITAPCPAPEFAHFETKKGISVKLKDTDKLQVLLQEAIDAGVTNINNIQFASSKFDELQDQAQVLATKNAKKRAVAIAESIGASIGKPYRINVTQSFNPSPRPEMAMMNKSMAMGDTASFGGKTIAVGQLMIRSNVYAEFIIQ
jgi:uncharacterized protein YggE